MYLWHLVDLSKREPVACALTAILAWLQPLHADTQFDPATIKVEIGLGGRCKLGHWAPVTIRFTERPQSDRLVLQTLDGDGSLCQYPAVAPNPGEQQQIIRRYIKVGRANEPLRILSSEEGDSWSTSQRFDAPVPSTQELFLVLGDDIDVAKSLKLRRSSQGDASSLVQISDATNLPNEWIGYDAFDAAVMVTGDSSFCESITPAQMAALRDWVALGGNLVISVGEHAEKLMGQGGALQAFAPGDYVDSYRQTETTELEDYSKSRSRLDLLWNKLPREQHGIDVARFRAGTRIFRRIRRRRREPDGLG